MQQVFLSFTYSPHPDYTAETEDLRRRVGMVFESMDLRPVTGEDLGGQGLNPEVKNRIEKADALVALLTPHADAAGNVEIPRWVADEFAHARALGKPAIRIVHSKLSAAGMFAGEEFIPHTPGKTVDTLLKLMRTLALWKRQHGRPMEIEIAPTDIGLRFDPARGHQCEFQLFQNFEESAWRQAKIWPEPGAIYAYIPGVPDQAKLRLRLRVDGETWQSEFHSPVGRVQLSRRNA
jgi:hypothetical protein